MNIQLKFLCIAAYEGFVHDTTIGHIEHYIKQVLLLVYHAGCKCYWCEGITYGIPPHY